MSSPQPSRRTRFFDRAAAVGVSFGDYLEARVRDLLIDDRRRPDVPGHVAIWTVALAVLALAFCAADPIHTFAEALMRFLDG